MQGSDAQVFALAAGKVRYVVDITSLQKHASWHQVLAGCIQ